MNVHGVRTGNIVNEVYNEPGELLGRRTIGEGKY
jgi:hypothetical protein